jgi:hypothetical protein
LFWPAERLILEHVATRQEIETHYSLSDIVDANAALDIWLAAQRAAEKK